MTYNYHTHTKRCGHATGEMENYVLRAIENGIKYMGFSEHISFQSPDGADAYFRLPKSQIQEYLDEVNILKEKYKDKISISLGFEMEYYPDSFEAMLKTAKDCNAEYLILGQHYLGKEGDGRLHCAGKGHTGDSITEYVDLVIDGMKTGKYVYLAHPDVLGYEGNDELWEKEMTRLCKCAKELKIPLEINCLGIRDHRSYSRESFYKIAGEVGNEMIIGFDAHDVMSAYDEYSLEKIKEFKEKYNLNIIEKIEIKGL